MQRLAGLAAIAVVGLLTGYSSPLAKPSPIPPVYAVQAGGVVGLSRLQTPSQIACRLGHPSLITDMVSFFACNRPAIGTERPRRIAVRPTNVVVTVHANPPASVAERRFLNGCVDVERVALSLVLAPDAGSEGVEFPMRRSDRR